MKKASILGSGSWGTALAILLAKKGLDPVTLWGRSRDVADAINESHRNPRYLTDITLPGEITATIELEATTSSELILFVVPSKATRQVAAALAGCGVPETAVLLSCSKGIERDTGLRMTQILEEFFPRNPIAVLSGPNHSEEIARELPGAAVIGSRDEDVSKRVQDVFTLPWFRSYTSDDVTGIEIGATIKNVFAIAAGIAEGLALGDNARAALVTRSLSEMIRVGTSLGGKPATFQGLSGVGDLIVTCYSEHSRNHKVGRMLGQGMTVQEVQDSLNMVAEGIINTDSVYQMARKAGLRTPITDEVHAILYENKAAAEALAGLLARDPRPEFDAEPSP